MLQHSPEIVSKSELSHALWCPDDYIDENTLQVNFARLRKTLKKFQLEDCIENVHGQGYGFRKWADE